MICIINEKLQIQSSMAPKQTLCASERQLFGYKTFYLLCANIIHCLLHFLFIIFYGFFLCHAKAAAAAATADYYNFSKRFGLK